MKWSLVKQILVAVGIVLVPNTVMLIFAEVLGVSRPWFNVDYAVAALVFILLPFWLSALCLGLFLFFDVVAVLGQMFPFLRLQDVVYLAKFVTIAPLSYQLTAVVALAVAAASLWLFRYLRQWSSRAAVLVVVNVCVYGYMGVVLAFGLATDDRIWRVKDQRILASQTVFNITARGAGFVESFREKGYPFEPAPYSGVTEPLFEPTEATNEKLLVVVTESWGVSSEPVMNDVLAPILDRRDQFQEVSRGTIPFEGATIAGELRELCRYWPKHFNLKEAENGFESCLPNRLKKKGYRTRAMHGAAGTMYDRAFWYPKAGFDDTVFFESRAWEHRCYSFPGACDIEMMTEVPRFFSQSGKGFFYWLTLNSHFFYDKRDVRLDTFDCTRYGLEKEPQVCRNLKLHAQFFHYFARMLERPEMEGVEVMVVGDHDPVITNWEEQGKYFKKNRVPWLRIRT